MEKISVIVPVYNTQAYLQECLDHLIGQTYPNIEIILVDDGSTDNSYAICESYQKQYDHIVLIHKENGGCGSARNAGMDLATGDYILHIDSDDWLIPTACEIIMNYATKYNADVVHCEVFRDPDKQPLVCDENPAVLSKKEILELMLNDRLRSGALKLFKRELVGDLRFPMKSTSIDDMQFFSELIEKMNCMVVSKSEIYFYRCFREDNLSNSSARFVRNVYERYQEFLKRYAIAQKCGVYGEEAFQKAVEHALVFYAHFEVAEQWKAERAEVETFIKENKKKIQQCPLLDRRTKTKCRVLNFNKRLFALLSKIFRRKG